jgi:hypothetical protein
MSQTKIEKCLDGIHKIEVVLTAMQKDVNTNTSDLAEHMKRTDLLEKKVSKVYVGVWIGAGFAAAHFGPEIIKYLGLLI